MMQLDEMVNTLQPLPGHVLIGLSGGADSVALFRLLLHLRTMRGIRLEAVHVNHGLRGAASDGDEQFVRRLCAAHGVHLLTYRAVPPPNPGEDWARQVRYGFFREAMRDTGAEALALAHHRDDQAETLLLHLMRGAGLTGLAGMAADAEVGGLRIIRPLLGFSREQLRELLTALGQDWREDASNQDSHYLRNAVRHELLPMMERLSPGASERIAAAAGLLHGDLEARQAQCEAFLKENAGSDWLMLAPLVRLHPAVQTEILRTWWQQHVGQRQTERSLDRRQTAAMLALLNGSAGQKIGLPGRWQAQRGWQCMHLVPPTARPTKEPVMLPAAKARLGRVLLEMSGVAADCGDGVWRQSMPRTCLTGCELRTRRQGDWIRPFGQSGKQSLQDYLVNRRVDAPFRDRLPLVCRGSEVLLAAGVGAGDVPVYDESKDNVCLMWSGEMPWARI